MQRFRNILVGVQLTDQHRMAADSSELGAPTQEAVQRALWLAEFTSARLTFFSALDLPTVADGPDSASIERMRYQVENSAQAVLAELVEQAEQRNIPADSQVAVGTPWREIIRQVLQDRHDLAIVGTRNQRGLRQFLFGSTDLKLIHNCPCPVWVVKPDPTPETINILMASDLSEVSQDALEIVISGAQAIDAKVHLLHAVEFPLDLPMRLTGLLEQEIENYRTQTRSRAEQRLHEQLSQTDYRTLTYGVLPHVVDGPADVAILQAIHDYEVDLLVIGTVARSGLPGVLIGNTVERLLPQVPCSVLAIKPRDFQSPLALDG